MASSSIFKYLRLYLKISMMSSILYTKDSSNVECCYNISNNIEILLNLPLNLIAFFISITQFKYLFFVILSKQITVFYLILLKISA